MDNAFEIQKSSYNRIMIGKNLVKLACVLDKQVQTEEYTDRCLMLGMNPNLYTIDVRGYEWLDSLHMVEVSVTDTKLIYTFDLKVLDLAEDNFVSAVLDLCDSFGSMTDMVDKLAWFNKKGLVLRCIGEGKEKGCINAVNFNMLMLFSLWNSEEYFGLCEDFEYNVYNVPCTMYFNLSNYRRFMCYLNSLRIDSLKQLFYKLTYIVDVGFVLDLSDSFAEWLLDSCRNTVYKIDFSPITFIKLSILKSTLNRLEDISGKGLLYPVKIHLLCYDSIPSFAVNTLKSIIKVFRKYNIHVTVYDKNEEW